ncbi:unnamed protein product, partial [Didymodactylos carnosus]
TFCRHRQKEACRRHFNEHCEAIVPDVQPLTDSIDELYEKIKKVDIDQIAHRSLDKLQEWFWKSIQMGRELFILKYDEIVTLCLDNKQFLEQTQNDNLEFIMRLKQETETLLKRGGDYTTF